MDTIFLVQDSLTIADTLHSSIIPSINVQCASNKEWWDTFEWIIPVLVSVFIYYLGTISNKKKEDKDDSTIEANRKMSLFKTLILDYNLKYVYDFFDNLDILLVELKQQDCDKRALEPKIQDEFKLLNEKFIFLLMAINQRFYLSILKLSDDFRDELVANIADDGINLYIDSKYTELIDKPSKNFKVKLLKVLFEYRGKEI